MKCPKCAVALLITERQGIEIDYCPECRGVWLDRGELDKIIERTNAEFGSRKKGFDDEDRRDFERRDDRANTANMARKAISATENRTKRSRFSMIFLTLIESVLNQKRQKMARIELNSALFCLFVASKKRRTKKI